MSWHKFSCNARETRRSACGVQRAKNIKMRLMSTSAPTRVECGPVRSTHGRHARATALVLVALITSTQLACASAEATVPPRPTQTGFHMVAAVPANAIEGRVTIRNVRSVERRTAANSEPYQATIAVLDSAGREVAMVRTDNEGRFRLQLPPGTYVLRPQSAGMYPRASEQQVQVRRNIVTQVEIVYDSGKR
jgi:hypothetical protein